MFNLGTGTTFAGFHADGKQAELIDMLKDSLLMELYCKAALNSR